MCTSNPNRFTALILTSGNDAEVGRRITQQIRLRGELEGHRLFPHRKTCVQSAGISTMSGVTKSHRRPTRGRALLVHERKHEK